MSSTWTSYQNGVRVAYTPTIEDLEDFEEVAGRRPTNTEIIAQGFFDGVTNQIGYAAGHLTQSAIASALPSRPALSERKITLCSATKITESDILAAKERVAAMEEKLIAAERMKNQAIEEYRQVLSEFGKNTDVSISFGAEGPQITVEHVQTVVLEDIPKAWEYKMKEDKACQNYNYTINQYGMAQGDLAKLQRNYNSQNNDSSGGFWFGVGQGLLGFIGIFFSKDF